MRIDGLYVWPNIDRLYGHPSRARSIRNFTVIPAVRKAICRPFAFWATPTPRIWMRKRALGVKNVWATRQRFQSSKYASPFIRRGLSAALECNPLRAGREKNPGLTLARPRDRIELPNQGEVRI
jgi:hypothetical protein